MWQSGSRADGKAGEELVVLSRILSSCVGSRETTSTLAGEYVTAQEHVGETEGRSKITDKNTLYKERAKRRRSDEATGEKGGEICTKS